MSDGRWVFWDFDGTLANRQGGWTDCLVEAVHATWPGLAVGAHDVRPLMSSGFPWHDPEQAHPHLDSPDAWWTSLYAHFDRVLDELGCPATGRMAAFELVRSSYVNPAAFVLADSAGTVLDRLRTAGIQHAIISNHVPELDGIVHALGIAEFFEFVLSSADAGFEKPNSAIFAIALDRAGTPDPGACWMVGDNPSADIAGAASVGMKPILLRATTDLACHSADSLLEVQALIDESRRGRRPSVPRWATDRTPAIDPSTRTTSC